MAGLQNIIERIQQNSEAVCDSILNEAQNKADDIRAAGAVETEKEVETIRAETRRQAKEIIDSAVSGSELEEKKELLSAKVDIINEVIDTVSATLKALPAEEYFASFYALVMKYARPEDGILYLSQKDLDRLPDDLETTLNGLLPAGSIRISKEPRDIDGGFILAYGGIEINCSYDALINEARDDIKDELSKNIFA